MDPYFGLFGTNNHFSNVENLNYPCQNYGDSQIFNNSLINQNDCSQNNNQQTICILNNNFLSQLTDSKNENLTNLTNNSIKINGITSLLNNLKCTICNLNEFKYKCPSCLSKTCSLKCFKTHKEYYNCNGLKNNLKYKKISDFDDKQLKQDFFFLEDCHRKIDNFKRDKKSIIQTQVELPSWLKKLRYEAKCRNINLKFLPAGFKKRLSNKSTYMYTLHEIHWDIEFVFPDILTNEKKSFKSIKLMYHRISENKDFNNILELIIKPKNFLEDQKLNKILKFYQESDLNSISILLEQPCKKFIELNLEHTVCKNLRNSTIIEYPTVFVILKKNLNNYNLIKEKLINKLTNSKVHQNIDEINEQN